MPNQPLKRENHKNTKIILAMLFALLIFSFFSFFLGRYSFSSKELLSVFRNLFFGGTEDISAFKTVFLNIRLPRILLALLVGAGLASSGASYQGVFQNPMASPDLLGASNGAALGAAIALLLGASQSIVTLSAFLTGLITVLLVTFISHHVSGQKTINLILGGIMISSLCTAGVSYIKLIADPSDKLPEITYWLMGSLSGARLQTVLFAFVFVLIGFVPLFLIRWRMNLLTLNEDEAKSMSVQTDKLRILIILCATLISAAIVSVSGLIGWVGLVIPHLARKVVGNNYKYLLPASAIIGAFFMLLVDNISRCMMASEMPIGILTAWIGVPFFIFLMVKKEGAPC